MKRILLTVFFVIIAISALCMASSAARLEKIPENLLFQNDTVTHFIVFEEEKYFLGSGDTIDYLDIEEMSADIKALGVDESEIGKKYLTKFIFPEYMNGNLITKVDVNVKGRSMKTTKYFAHVCGYVVFPSAMTKTNDMNQVVTELRGVDFGENSQLIVIPTCFAADAQKLKEVKNFPTEKLQTIESGAFNKAKYAFSGELVINAKKVEGSAFNNAITYVTSMVFGENFQSCADQSFSVRSAETGLGAPRLEHIEFKCDVTQISYAANSLKGFYFSEVCERSEFSNLKCIILSNPANKDSINDGVTTFSEIAPNSKIQFFADSTKDVVYTSHSISMDNATISYKSFLESGELTGYCERCGKGESTPTAPLFSFEGISSPENGRVEIYVLFSADYEAIERYEKLSSNTVDFGIVLGAKDLMGGKAPLDSDGNAITLENGAVIKAPAIAQTKYVSYELRITGFTVEQADIMLLVASYVHITDKDGETVSVNYLQSSQVVDNNFAYISYNNYNNF